MSVKVCFLVTHLTSHQAVFFLCSAGKSTFPGFFSSLPIHSQLSPGNLGLMPYPIFTQFDSSLNNVFALFDRVYNSSNLSDIQLSQTIRHNNHTGRWLTNFRPEWIPGRDDLFIVGSMVHPRQVIRP